MVGPAVSLFALVRLVGLFWPLLLEVMGVVSEEFTHHLGLQQKEVRL